MQTLKSYCDQLHTSLGTYATLFSEQFFPSLISGTTMSWPLRGPLAPCFSSLIPPQKRCSVYSFKGHVFLWWWVDKLSFFPPPFKKKKVLFVFILFFENPGAIKLEVSCLLPLFRGLELDHIPQCFPRLTPCWFLKPSPICWVLRKTGSDHHWLRENLFSIPTSHSLPAGTRIRRYTLVY